MSDLLSPNAARTGSYTKVFRIGLRTKKQAFDFRGSGFFTAGNPHLLMTAAHVEAAMLRLGTITADYFDASHQARLCGFTQSARKAQNVRIRHGRSIFLENPAIDIAALWVTTEEHPIVINIDRHPPFGSSTLEVNPANIDPQADYFVPVLKDGQLFELCGKASPRERDNGYVVGVQTWPGYSGSPLIDEDGKAVGVIFAGTDPSIPTPTPYLPGSHPTLTCFTPFSALNKLGLFKSFMSY